MSCYSGGTNKSGTTKDEQNNRVTAHEQAEKAKVSCLHNMEDTADVEDAAEVEQNGKAKIIKKKWQDIYIFSMEE